MHVETETTHDLKKPLKSEGIHRKNTQITCKSSSEALLFAEYEENMLCT